MLITIFTISISWTVLLNSCLSSRTLAQVRTPYIGILGVECTLTGEDKFYVNEFKPFFQEHDAKAVLNLINDDLVQIFTSCINGFFSDEYEEIRMNNCFSTSATVLSRQNNKIINGLENIEDLEKGSGIDRNNSTSNREL